MQTVLKSDMLFICHPLMSPLCQLLDNMGVGQSDTANMATTGATTLGFRLFRNLLVTSGRLFTTIQSHSMMMLMANGLKIETLDCLSYVTLCGMSTDLSAIWFSLGNQFT